MIVREGGVNRRMAMRAMLLIGFGPTALAGAQESKLVARPGVGPTGTITDPDLVQPQVPWERTLDKHSLETLRVLCDLILPADSRSPSAGELGAHDFIDEWVSAPYERQQEDRQTITDGLGWLDDESARRFSGSFVSLSDPQQRLLCDEICTPPDPSADAADAANADGNTPGARGFDRVRSLTLVAFWTTQEGMDDLGYIGNVPLAKWQPPPAAVLRHLGLG